MAIDIDQSFYKTGTASVANGSTAVTGQGTLWTQTCRAGDLFGTHVGDGTRILSIESNTSLTLAYPWQGASQTAADYEIQFAPYDVGYQAAVRKLLTVLASGNIEAFGELIGYAGGVPVFTGAGTMGLLSKADLVTGVAFNVQVDTLPERDAYDAEPEGFAVLVADVGDGRAALYTKNSGTTGDWSDPSYITGPVGPLASINVGTTTTGLPGTNADVTNSGTATEPVLDFTIPAGKGFQNRGEYNAATAYVEGDVVRSGGSSFIARVATTGNPPPILPIQENTYWSLLAQMGDGGDMYKSTYDPTNQNRDIFADVNTRVRFDTAQSLTAAEQGQARVNIGADILSGFRNKIINGDFDIWQRGTSQSTSGYGSDDRWVNHSNGYTRTHTQQTFPIGDPNVPGSPTFFSRTVITVAGSGASHTCVKRQRIEGVRTLAGKTATLTFWAKANAARNIAVEIVQGFGSGGSPNVEAIGTTTCNLTTAWQKFSIPIQMPSIVGKTLGDGDFLAVSLWFGAGSDFNTRTNSLGHQTGTFDIAHVSLVEGDATAEADPFSPRHIQQELALCQRYYEKSYDQGVTPGAVNEGRGVLWQTASNAMSMFAANTFFLVEKRTIPSMTLYNPVTGAVGSARIFTTSTDIAASWNFTTTRVTGSVSAASGTDASNYGAHFTADAEL